jgi:hypothetical protein
MFGFSLRNLCSIASRKGMVSMETLHKIVAMGKALLVILGVSAIVLLSGSIYAYPPIIYPIPDVIIGDIDDQEGWMIDRNLFRFPDVFSFLDYVEDWDTTVTLLKWSFIEEASPGGTPSNWFEINGITQTTVGNTNPPPTEKDLTLGGADFRPSLRDIYASPHSEDPGPYTGITEAQAQHSKLIFLYASDGTQEDSRDVMIYSIDGTFDRLSSYCYPKRYTFDSSTEGFNFTAPSNPSYSGATSGWSGGRISISSPNDSTSRVGLFSGPTEIAYVAGNVFRARFTVTSSQATASANPQIRLRWIQDQSLESTSLVLNASGTFSNALPTDPTTKDYTVYFSPILSGSMGVAFDMLDFDENQHGTFYVDEITVDWFPRGIPATPVKSYDTASDFGNWQFVMDTGSYGPVYSGGTGTGMLSITSTTANASNFGFWQCSGTANELTYVEDKFYRATYTLSCTSEAARNDMPQIRLRVQNEDGQMAQTMELNSQGTGGPGAMPELGGTQYEIYWETPTLPGSPSAAEDGFIVAIDMLDFDPTKGGTINMEQVAIEFMTIP